MNGVRSRGGGLRAHYTAVQQQFCFSRQKLDRNPLQPQHGVSFSSEHSLEEGQVSSCQLLGQALPVCVRSQFFLIV